MIISFDSHDKCTIEYSSGKRIKKTNCRNKLKLDRLEYLKTELRWMLSRLTDNKYISPDMEFYYSSSSKQLDEKIDQDLIEKALNASFETAMNFELQEGDTLNVYYQYLHNKIKGRKRPNLFGYMLFQFDDGLWKSIDYLEIIDKEYDIVKSGTINTD